MNSEVNAEGHPRDGRQDVRGDVGRISNTEQAMMNCEVNAEGYPRDGRQDVRGDVNDQRGPSGRRPRGVGPCEGRSTWTLIVAPFLRPFLGVKKGQENALFRLHSLMFLHHPENMVGEGVRGKEASGNRVSGIHKNELRGRLDLSVPDLVPATQGPTGDPAEVV